MEEQEGINNIFKNLQDISEIKKCFYHKKTECKGDVISAHSIPQSGRLDLIKGVVNKKNKVFSLSEIFIENGIVKKGIRAIGWGKKAASTFFGFCAHHDKELFKPIENNNDFDNSPEHCFLHSYRSFAFSYHELKKTYKLAGYTANAPQLTKIQNSLSDLLNKIKPIETKLKQFPLDTELPQELLKNQLGEVKNKISTIKKQIDTATGKQIETDFLLSIENIRTTKDVLELLNKLYLLNEKLKSVIQEFKKVQNPENLFWMDWMNKYKTKLDFAIENKSYDGLKYYCRIKDELFPFACAFAFSPDFLYS